MIRMFVQAPLSASATAQATPNQAHYLANVMRRGTGDPVCLFNGQDGEWAARIESVTRAAVMLRAEALLRPQAEEPDIWLVFGLLKRDTTDLVVQKATELGAAAILPAVTEHTNAGRTNEDRLRAIAIEAAEQCERLTVPAIRPVQRLDGILAAWPSDRRLFVAMERSSATPLSRQTGPVALLVGPEGGFGPRDRAVLDRVSQAIPVSLGPRILRAETAALAGLALLQAPGYG